MPQLTDDLSALLVQVFNPRSAHDGNLTALEATWIRLMMPVFNVVTHEQGSGLSIQRKPISATFLEGRVPSKLPDIDRALEPCITSFSGLLSLGSSKTQFKSITDVPQDRLKRGVGELDFAAPAPASGRTPQDLGWQILCYAWYKYYRALQRPNSDLDALCESFFQKINQEHCPLELRFWAKLSLARLYLVQAESLLGLDRKDLARKQEQLKQKIRLVKGLLTELLPGKHFLVYILHALYLRNLAHAPERARDSNFLDLPNFPVIENLVIAQGGDPILSEDHPLYLVLRRLLGLKKVETPRVGFALRSTEGDASAPTEHHGRPTVSDLPLVRPKPAQKPGIDAEAAQAARLVVPPVAEPQGNFLQAPITSIPGPSERARERGEEAREEGIDLIALSQDLVPDLRPAFNNEQFIQEVLAALGDLDHLPAALIKTHFELYTVESIVSFLNLPMPEKPLKEKARLLAKLLSRCEKFSHIDPDHLVIIPGAASLRWVVSFYKVITDEIERELKARYAGSSKDLISRSIGTTLSWVDNLYTQIQIKLPSRPRSAAVFLNPGILDQTTVPRTIDEEAWVVEM